jgi:hypothetical protein
MKGGSEFRTKSHRAFCQTVNMKCVLSVVDEKICELESRFDVFKLFHT